MTRTNVTENGRGGGGGGEGSNGGGVAVVGSTKKTLIRVGKYQMLGPLGKGNFARVEEAIHTVLGVKVSVINSTHRRERAEAPSLV